MSHSVRSLELAFDSPKGVSRVTLRWYAATTPGACLLLGHGAGAGQDHPFMTSYAAGIAERGVDVVTFNFPYKERGQRAPDRNDVLEAGARGALRRVIDECHGRAVFAGGKSMGGRILSQVVAAGEPVAGMVFLGYPLHPVGSRMRPRTAHWPSLTMPCLFVQGSRDTFATPEELLAATARLGGPSRIEIVEGGDHSFAVTRATGRSQDDVAAAVQDLVASWVADVAPR